jgi:hypothetical protein
MTTKALIATAATLLVIALAGAPAHAQDQKVPEPVGVTARGLVTSLGPFAATVNEPLFVTGSSVELAPGGQTGRQQFRVPTFVYVIEGVLTSDYQDGPVGIKGSQDHAAGQSFMDNGGWWHNHANRSPNPVKYLILHLGYPGRPDPVQKAEKED